MVCEFPVLECSITAIKLSHKQKALFVGTSKGTIRIYSWPLNDETLEYEIISPNSHQVKLKLPEFYEIQAHSEQVTCLEISHDNNFLFSGAQDGTLYVFNVNKLIRYFF